MKIGILVHGCNLGAFQWEHIVWGDPPNHLGRLTRALLLLMQYEYILKSEVAVLVLGTGVVWTGGGKRNGCMEAHETHKILFEKLHEIPRFTAFDRHFPAVHSPQFLEQLRARLTAITELTTDCQNTAQEVTSAAKLFIKHNVDTPIIVSSPVHIPRCLKEACVALSDSKYASIRNSLMAAQSDTCYQGTTADNVAIFEPPHRPDRPMFPINQFVQRIANVAPDKMSLFLKELDDLLERHGA